MLFLLVAIPLSTAVLMNNGFDLRIAALENDEPRNVVISNITEQSFRVSWITEKETVGGVELSDATKYTEDDVASYHTVEVTSLDDSRTYNFRILSASKSFGPEDGEYYDVKTANTSTSKAPFLIYGQVFSPDGFSVQQNGVISIKLSNGNLESQIFSTRINETGGYKFDIGGMLDENLARSFPYKSRVEAAFKIFVSHEEKFVERTYTLDFSDNRQVPNIYLGETSIEVVPGIDGTDNN